MAEKKILALYEGLIHELLDMVKEGSFALIHLVCINNDEKIQTVAINDGQKNREVKQWLEEFESALSLGLRPIGMIAWTQEPGTGALSPFYRTIEPYEDEEWVENEIGSIIDQVLEQVKESGMGSITDLKIN